MCQYILICIGVYCNTSQYFHCFTYIWHVWWHVLWHVLWYVMSVFAGIEILFVHNTDTIHTNTEWYVLNTYLFVSNTFWYVFNTYHQYIPQYTPQCMLIHCVSTKEDACALPLQLQALLVYNTARLAGGQ